MALWGMAMANIDNEERAADFARRAWLGRDSVTERERMYIDSLAAFYEVEGEDSRCGTFLPAGATIRAVENDAAALTITTPLESGRADLLDAVGCGPSFSYQDCAGAVGRGSDLSLFEGSTVMTLIGYTSFEEPAAVDCSSGTSHMPISSSSVAANTCGLATK